MRSENAHISIRVLKNLQLQNHHARARFFFWMFAELVRFNPENIEFSDIYGNTIE